MALMITDECINCDMCLPECPNEAIFEGKKIYHIDALRCSECVGFYPEPTCVAVCPIHCVKPDPQHVETHEELCLKFETLHKSC